MRIVRLAVVLATLTLVAACEAAPAGNHAAPSDGGSVTSTEPTVPPTPSSAPRPAGPPDPCGLITDEEAAAAGVVVITRQLTEHPPSPVVPTERNCLIWGTIDSYITVQVSEGGRADYDLYLHQNDIEYSFRLLPGLGDAAHAITTGAVVLTGDYVTVYNLQLYKQGVEPATQQERVIALATAGTSKILGTQ